MTIGDALRQAFMNNKHEYDSLQDKSLILNNNKIQRLCIIVFTVMIAFSILVSTIISLKIVFPADPGRRPFCKDLRILQQQQLPVLSIHSNFRDVEGGAFSLTDQETVDYYWMVVFLPSATIFVFSALYLFAGIAVSYTAPVRHGCLKVVENNYCASKRGGVRCLSILNLVFAIIFGLLALFLGSTLLTLGSKCSIPLFWCYEISLWGLVILYGGTAFHLRRKAASILDGSDFVARNLGLEMLEANPAEFTPDVERRVNEGFRSWMGSSYLSSDDDEEEEIDPNSYQEVQHLSRTNSSRQKM
uniref:uncharacterized protein LOC122609713 n=1 Tax=Erigeron canadensis TaxID=72917 RepID=UPI001CB8E908|nr:uncharacterized protein LOC122609713 [Erigeron canadensis]